MTSERCRRRRSIGILLTMAAFLVATEVMSVVAGTSGQAAVVPKAEAWVLQRVATGHEADLEPAFPEPSDRVLSAPFLRRLLTRPLPGVPGNALGVVIVGATVRGRLDLRNEDIAHDTRCVRCRFEDDVLLVQARFRRTLELTGTHCLKRADFRYVEIAGNLEADDAFFGDVTFERIKIGGDLFLRRAAFQAWVNFWDAKVSGNLGVDGARFEQGASFERSNVAGHLYMNAARFHGPVGLGDVVVGGVMNANGGQFLSEALLGSLVVRGQARFREATFKGPADFSYAEIGKYFDLSKTQFLAEDASVNFFSLKVTGNADFSDAMFAGGVHLAKADVGGNLTLERVRAANRGKDKTFNGLKADVLILSDAQLAPPYWMTGITYRIIHGTSPPSVLALLRGAGQNTHALTSLEAFYQLQGQVDTAKAVHVARRRDERRGLWPGHPVGYIWNWVEDLVAGYGRYLERALLWSVMFVLIGCGVFWRREWMETQKPAGADGDPVAYNPFWYSLALFLPISGLDDAKIWMPRRDRRKARIYQRLHIVMGYLLIPIGIAAWTGIIK